MKQEHLKMEVEKTIQVSEEEIFSVNGKNMRKKFQASVPRSSVDFRILCEVFEPKFISNEMEEYDGKDFLGAVVYKINEHNKIRRTFARNLGQSILGDALGFQMLKYLDTVKLKLIDPNSEFLRIGRRNDKDIYSFLELGKVPDELKIYLNERNRTESQETLHNQFWLKLFQEDKRGVGITRLLDWIFDVQESMNADILIPMTPFINTKNMKSSIEHTGRINSMSHKLKGDRGAFYLVLDVDVLKNNRAVNQIANIISDAENRFIIIKMLGLKKITQVGYGKASRENLEFLLKILRDKKQLNPDIVAGLLDGGGFGYCLVGAGIDFFTDTVNNYYQDSFPKMPDKRKHRALLNPTTFSLEPFEGVIQQMRKHGHLFVDCSVADKYRGKEISMVDMDKWSVDARKMGLIVWQKRMASLLSGNQKFGLDKIRFDEILNSDFAILGNIVRRVINGN